MCAVFVMKICLSIGKKAEKSDLISPYCPCNEAIFQGFIGITSTDVITVISAAGATENSQIWLFHLYLFLPCTNVIGFEKC